MFRAAVRDSSSCTQASHSNVRLYSEQSDVYAMGIVLWELLTRSDPYDRRAAAAVPEPKPSVLCLRAEMAVQCNRALSGTIYTVYSNSSSCEQLRRRRQITAAAFDRTRRKKAAGKTVHKHVPCQHQSAADTLAHSGNKRTMHSATA